MSWYAEESEARDRVVQVAMDLVDTWDWSDGNDYVAVTDLERAVHALRSLNADRGPSGGEKP